MTDDQFLKIILMRAEKACKNYNVQFKNPRLVLTGTLETLYFALKFDNAIVPVWLGFAKNGKKQIFILPELSTRLMDWKQQKIHKMRNFLLPTANVAYVEFDIHNEPKEVVHIFFNAIISALNTPGMSVCLMIQSDELFSSDETYEEVQIKSDLMEFDCYE